MKRFECVPNFSEGRDAAKIALIVEAARSVPGVRILDVESNADHNRSVVSLFGKGPALVEGVFRMMTAATRSIDLNEHRGEHPRMGATDVVPFVPLFDSSMADAVELAGQLAKRVWEELQIPVYLYAAAARRPERMDLAVVREGQFEGLRETIGKISDRDPDVGEPKLHPTAGAVAIGARPILIAYNAYLSTPDVGVARRIAHAVRARDGGLAEVKALGFEIRERNRAQVSMNLTDYHRTPLHRALEAVRREATRYGASVEESEIVGLVPEDALLDAAEFYLQLNRFDRATLLERKVRQPEPVEATPPAAGEPFPHFLDRLAARTPTPGGGSAAAAAGALGAALGEMVLAYSVGGDSTDPAGAETTQLLNDSRRRFLALMEEDAEAYEAVRAARRDAKEHPGNTMAVERWHIALRRAADVPLQTARHAATVRSALETISPRVKTILSSDLLTSLALLEAAQTGALANVEINLQDLRSQGEPTSALESEIAQLRAVS